MAVSRDPTGVARAVTGALDRLMAVETGPRVSVLVPVAPDDPRQDEVRVRRLAGDAVTRLGELGAHPGTITDLTGALPGLVAAAHPLPRFVPGIAAFTAPGFSTVVPLPTPVDELVTVDDRFHLTELVAVTDALHCHVLTIARRGVALWRATRWSFTRVELPGAPDSVEEITRFRKLEKQLQLHQTARGGTGTSAPMYHGHGVGEARETEPVRIYFRRVDAAVTDVIGDDPAPILLVGPSSLPALYRSVSSLRTIADTAVQSHPEGIDAMRVHERAVELLAVTASQRQKHIEDQIGASRRDGRSSHDVVEIATAAEQGRVGTLLFDPRARVWGTVDDGGIRVDSGGERELVNRMVVATVRQGGDVVPVTSTAEPVAALFRY